MLQNLPLLVGLQEPVHALLLLDRGLLLVALRPSANSNRRVQRDFRLCARFAAGLGLDVDLDAPPLDPVVEADLALRILLDALFRNASISSLLAPRSPSVPGVPDPESTGDDDVLGDVEYYYVSILTA